MKIKTLLALFSLLMLTHCSHPTVLTPDYMTLEKVEYVKEFPETFQLSGETVPNIDVIGIYSIVVYDTLLIVSTSNADGLWYFFSLPSYKPLGNFLKKGNGPNEFIQIPWASSNMQLFTEEGHLVAFIHDFEKGRMLRMDVSETLRTGKQSIALARDSLAQFSMNILRIDSTRFFCEELNFDRTQKLRYLLEGNQRTTPPVLQLLNRATIKKDEDHNIMSTITKFNPVRGRIIEMSALLNYINMYSLDGTFAKTICHGDELDCIAKIQEKEQMDRRYTFDDMRLYNSFWGVVLINKDRKLYRLKQGAFPSILLFDWEGKPLAELKMNQYITTFDIDFNNGVLYAFDLINEELFKYDISRILEKLNLDKE